MIWWSALAGFVFAWLVYGLRQLRRRRRLRRHFRRAEAAERRAAALLSERGFKILAVQPRQTLRYRVGSRRFLASVRADYLVRRRLRRYIVEVKTGTRAPDPAFRATRRQLQEYWMAFPHPILLLNMETGSLEQVRFNGLERRRLLGGVFRFLLALAGLWLLSLFLR